MMLATEQNWATVDEYINGLLVTPDAVLTETLAASKKAGLPDISVTAAQGKFLHLLVKMHGARKVLEIGTLGGYSTIWMARALPADGTLITLEAEAKHAEIATANIARAGLSKVVEVRLGPALETLPRLAGEGLAPFDFIFIDADKTGYPEYFKWAMKLSRRGTVIIADNVVRKGQVADSNSADERVQGVRKYNELLAGESRVSATIIQTVGSKGHDGFALGIVTAD